MITYPYANRIEELGRTIRILKKYGLKYEILISGDLRTECKCGRFAIIDLHKETPTWKCKCCGHNKGDLIEHFIDYLEIRNDGEVLSSYRGVFWDEQEQRWSAKILIDRKLQILGCFDTQLEASNAYKELKKSRVA